MKARLDSRRDDELPCPADPVLWLRTRVM
jgi:hypothetical protein